MSKRDRAMDLLQSIDENQLDDVLNYLERIRLGRDVSRNVYVGEFPDVIGGIGGRDKR